VVTRRRTTGSTSGGRTTRRRTTSRTGSASYRRRTPKTSTTLGSAFALGLVALFTRVSWPIRIGIVVVALLAVAGYLVIRARRGAGPEASEDSAPSGPSAPSAPEAAGSDPKESQS
jgi:hypothetical protein